MSAPLTVDSLPRHKEKNHFNYTDEEKDEKSLAIEKMTQLYPTVPVMYCDWVYDLCKNTSEEEMKKIKERIEESEITGINNGSSKK